MSSGDPNSLIYNYVLVYQQLFKMSDSTEEMNADQLIDSIASKFGFKDF
jgi:hypothetical protein